MRASEVAAVEALARAAGQAAMAHYGLTSSRAKADLSPVTAADLAANAVIVAGLQEMFPGDAILSEESADDLRRLHSERVWIVDPLDGTKEFLSQNGEFSVMIGLAEAGEPNFGVVYAPALGALYSAVRGQGAWVERAGRRTPLTCSPSVADAGLRLVGSRSHAEPIVDEIRARLGVTDVRACGSVGLKCALIAEGERDLYIHPVPYLREWDTCAPEIILREAGGRVSDCSGTSLRYNKERAVQPNGILASGPGCPVAALGEVVAMCGKRPGRATTG